VCGIVEVVFDVDVLADLSREVLRERRAALIAEACAWAVGLSDRQHQLRRHGRVLPSGSTLGERAASGLPLSGEEDGRLDLGDARPGSFQDALNALRPDGSLYADAFDDEVLDVFVHDTVLAAADRLRRTRPAVWHDLVDDVGEDEDAEPADVVRAGDWEAPLRIVAEQLVLAALGAVPLLEVETEGLPLSMVRAAEALARAAAEPPAPADLPDDVLAGALFLAREGMRAAGLATPVPEAQAGRLLAVLMEQGLEPDEVPAVLDHLPVEPAAAAKVRALLPED
jgi:hypothetical protein